MLKISFAAKTALEATFSLVDNSSLHHGLCEAGVSSLSTATLRHRVLRAQGAVAKAPGYPDVPRLSPLLPPAVLKPPELAVTVLSITHSCHGVSVLVLLRQGGRIEQYATMIRKKLGAIRFPDLFVQKC